MKKIVPMDAVLIPDTAMRVFQGVIYGVYQWQQELFDGSETTFEMLRRPDTVSVICIIDDKVLIINDEQPHRGSRLSFPGGRVDDGDEAILHAAKREVHEETGHSFKQWRLVKVWQPQTKIEWFIHLFIAWDVAEVVAPHLDAGEKIAIEFLSFEKAKQLVAHNSSLGEATAIFEDLNSTSELLALPEFQGREIEP
jgi:ADP-ribose pyrophosphatase